MSTILDVERISGVSKSTISRFLNGKNVTSDNRRKIESAIAELDYTINPMASSLKTNRTHLVGIVIPDITDPFFPPIIRQLERKLREKGYNTLINNYGNDWKLEQKQVELMLNQRVDGLVIASSAPDVSHLEECVRRKVPTVLLDRVPEGITQCDTVTVDNFQSTFDALTNAIRHGHRKIGIVRAQKNVYSNKVRYQGYREALRQNGIEYRKEYEIYADLVEHDAARQFMRLLNLPDPPTLIFCPNVYLAAGAWEAVVENNLDIPNDVSILAFDRLASFPYYQFLKSIQPEFTSICQPLDAIAKQTASLILERMEAGEKLPPRHIELKTSFSVASSIKDLTRP